MHRSSPSSRKLAPALLAPALLGGALLAASSGPPAGSLGPALELEAEARRLGSDVLASLPTGSDPCTSGAALVARGSVRGLEEDLAIEAAGCLNLTDGDALRECLTEAWSGFREGLDVVLQQHDARLEACALVGGGAYAPVVDPDDFVDGVDHPWFPLPAGATWLYHKVTREGLETTEVHVTGDTREILGVDTTVVRATERLDGDLIEDTFDYFAQDAAGNVWYFGELTMAYEEGELVSLEGSWLASDDGASPGLHLPAAPVPDVTYRREYLIGVAEDLSTIDSLDQPVDVPYGAFDATVKTIDFNPLEPWELECKHYAPGVGLVLEVDEGTHEETVLVDASGL